MNLPNYALFKVVYKPATDNPVKGNRIIVTYYLGRILRVKFTIHNGGDTLDDNHVIQEIEKHGYNVIGKSVMKDDDYFIATEK